MVERGGEAIVAAWPRKYRICIEGDVDPRSGAPRFLPCLGGPSFVGLAQAALLAALDPHDSKLQEIILGAMGFWRGEDFGPMARVQAHDAIAALRDSIRSPQASSALDREGSNNA